MSAIRRLENPSVLSRLRELPLSQPQRMAATAVYVGVSSEPFTTASTVARALSYTLADTELILAGLAELGLVVPAWDAYYLNVAALSGLGQADTAEALG